jgi:flavin-dependent dehydrogenase
MHFALDPAEAAELASHVELVLFGAGYAGLQPVEGGVANVSLLIERTAFAQAGESWAGVQALLEAEAPHMRRRLRGARALLDRPVSIFRVPYGYIHAPSRDDEASVFRLGDQAGVIPSFSGDGIAMALHSAFCAVEGVRRGSADAYHARLRRDISGQVARAGLLYRLGRSAPGLVTRVAETLPGAIRWAARLTRIPDWALDLR